MISVYLLLDLCPSPFPCLCPFPFPCLFLSLCLFLPPVQPPVQPPPRLRPRLLPGPASRPSPVPDLPVRFPCPALPGDGNGRKCRPDVRRGTVGRRIVAEVFPERAARHPWATETGVGVARACAAAPLGDGTGQKCRQSVRRGTLGRRIVAEMFPERAAQHHWVTETGGSVAQACGAFLVCKLLKKDASPHGSRNALWNVSNRLGWSRRKGMLIYPVLDVVLVSVGGVAGDHLTDESG